MEQDSRDGITVRIPGSRTCRGLSQVKSQFQNVVSQLRIMSIHELSISGGSACIDGAGTDGVEDDRLVEEGVGFAS